MDERETFYYEKGKVRNLVALDRIYDEVAERGVTNFGTLLKVLGLNADQISFVGGEFYHIDFSRCGFIDCNFAQATFQECKLIEAEFNDCDCEIRGADIISLPPKDTHPNESGR